MPKAKAQLNVRISVDARELLDALQNLTGLSQAGIVELLIRERARAEGLIRVEPVRDNSGPNTK